MKTQCLLSLILLLFSCTDRNNDELYQGKLEELIVGDFALEKDSLTRYIYNIRMMDGFGEEYISFEKPAMRRNELTFAVVSTNSGKEVDRIKIPTEGPESIGGRIQSTIIASKDQIFQVNNYGEIGEYSAEGKQIAIYEFLSDYKTKGKSKKFKTSSFQVNQFRKPFIQLGNDPSGFLNPNEIVAPGELISEFPLDFKEWITHVNLETGQVETSNFSIPSGYELFKNDHTAVGLFGAFDSTRNLYYLAWPYSDEVYVLDGVKLERVLKPFSSVEFMYLPTEQEAAGAYSIFVQPINASKQLFLLYDEQKDLIIRCSKINESGASESRLERTKHYVLSIYSGDWSPKGEYFFDFENQMGMQNWFLTSEALFINKPEQEAEDKYEFYKIDLSKFAD